MREAAVPGYRLSKARRSTRVLITLGMVGMLLGLLSAVAMAVSKTGISPTSVQQYYLGIEDITADPSIVPNSPRPFAEMAEVTHLHLMGGSLLLFLLCHLLALCDVEEKTRTTLYVVSFVSFLSTFLLPWLIIYVAPVFAYGYGPSVVVLLTTMIALTVIPLREMWL